MKITFVWKKDTKTEIPLCEHTEKSYSLQDEHAMKQLLAKRQEIKESDIKVVFSDDDYKFPFPKTITLKP